MLIIGEAYETLRKFQANTFDALITDPPAGISFMGKEWDGDKGGRDHWIAWLEKIMREALRTMKPGAHGLVWSLPRTSHWTAMALENAGFELRDVVTHLYGQGFPKSLDVSKAIDKQYGYEEEREILGYKTQGTKSLLDGGKPRKATAPATAWRGWGTALKPAAEFWWLVQKPLSEPTVAQNVLKWGTVALNIDACRIGYKGEAPWSGASGASGACKGGNVFGDGHQIMRSAKENAKGRWPANLTLDVEAARMLDEQSGELQSGTGAVTLDMKSMGFGTGGRGSAREMHGDRGGASRFFYVPKPAPGEKNEGLEEMEKSTVSDGRQKSIDNPFLLGETERRNTHPTVKPAKLMRYYAKLITPAGGIVLDCFAGSGTTGVGALQEGFRFQGIEMSPEYAAIAEARIKAAGAQGELFKKAPKRSFFSKSAE